MLLLRSKLYRELVLYWSILLLLLGWSLVATFAYFNKNDKLILIGISETDTRIITDTKDRLLQNELLNFITFFITSYYNYDSSTFSSQLDRASNLISSSLWESLKPKLIDLKTKLEEVQLKQAAEIESIDLIEQNIVDVLISITITRSDRISDYRAKLKVRLNLSQNNRNEMNPWPYEIINIDEHNLL